MANEVRLVDANAFRNKRKNATIYTHERYGCEVVEYIDIVNAPTIDPESLRPKGRWFEMIERKEDGYTGEYYEEVYYNCVNCDYASDWNSPYCPNCGCKMEG